MLLATITVYALCTFGPGGCGAAGDGFDATRPSDLKLARAYRACVLKSDAARLPMAKVRTDCANKLNITLDEGTSYAGPMVALDDGKPVTKPPVPSASQRTISCVHATVTLESIGPNAQPSGATIRTKLAGGSSASQHIAGRFGTDLWATCAGFRIAISEIDRSHPNARRVRVFSEARNGQWVEFKGTFDPFTPALPKPPACTDCAASKTYWDNVDGEIRKTATIN